MKRSEVPVAQTWDLSLIYKSPEEAWQDAARLKELAKKAEQEFRGKLKDAQSIVHCLHLYEQLHELASRISAYFSLNQETDYNNAENVSNANTAEDLITDCLTKTSFVESEILEAETGVIEEAARQGGSVAIYLKKLLRKKPHVLHPEAERVLAALGSFMSTPYNVYNQAKLADMRFDDFTANGKTYPLGYALFEDSYEYEQDTAVRRAAFRHFSDKIRQYENVTAAAYNAYVCRDKRMAGLRGFNSVFDYLLFDENVTRDLYDRQIDVIMEKLAPHMRRYAALLQRVHGLDKMTYADLKLSVDPGYDPSVTMEEAEQYIADSWQSRMSDVVTLAHELGHAGHFRECNAAQGYFDTLVPMYYVEAPSTINELLLAGYLEKKKSDPRFRRWVLGNMIGNTYYHNFVTHLLEAAYQREVYRIVDKGGSVQAETLSAIYRDVLTQFWGDSVELTDGAELTWMRQPHYYMGLYSYTYSAGLTIATEVSEQILKEGERAAENWKKALRAGSTVTPVEFARMAGVDITTDRPLLDTIEKIGSMIDEMCTLTEEIGF